METVKESICWSCSNCYGECSWSRSFKPVSGWKAKYSKTLDSYTVQECPNYKEDSDCVKCEHFVSLCLNKGESYSKYCSYCTYVSSLSISNQRCKGFVSKDKSKLKE